MSIIRVRFAPSPTGPIHLGGIRTALYNYLLAKKYNGKFILRIEDTDQNRYLHNAVSYILKSLKWCGIEPNEGFGYGGGPYEPYIQSKRSYIYKFYINYLLKNKYAYYAFDTNKDLEIKRNEYKKLGLNFSYDHRIRMSLNNSLTMTKENLIKKLKCNIPYVIRFKVIPGLVLKVNDMIRGDIKFNTNYLDDKVLLKSNGMATYHLANTIDDYTMKITHVLRGEEWISSMFIHILIYKSFGWAPPNFAHLPLILNKNGKGKISKRNLNYFKFPLFPIEWKEPSTNKKIYGYKELGYFPDAFINMLAMLGWNPGNNREIFSLEELVNFFSIKKINKSGVFFDKKKAIWFNKQYIIKNKNKIFLFLAKELKNRSILFDNNFLWKVIDLTIDRINFIYEIWDHTYYFFIEPDNYDKSFISKIKDKNYVIKNINILLNKLNFNSFNELKCIFSELENKKFFMKLIRFSIVGSLKGIELFKILEMIGKKQSIKRIKKFIKKIESQVY
ncbi:glutamate--tRNA ligase [Blattabacterium cuenoti]|uniref:glutamate--tRNA ligase n=1 Tax=Blattabacterium cuenoti TaxID=1653831 RepID=UPI00163C4E2A|nr:glutamate--tRNA ligase [Blattabacterium cuenoti]